MKAMTEGTALMCDQDVDRQHPPDLLELQATVQGWGFWRLTPDPVTTELLERVLDGLRRWSE